MVDMTLLQFSVPAPVGPSEGRVVQGHSAYLPNNRSLLAVWVHNSFEASATELQEDNLNAGQQVT